MMASGSSDSRFVSRWLKKEDGATITSEELYSEYHRFCEENNLGAVSADKFHKRVPTLISYAVPVKVMGASGKQVRGWRNVKVVGERRPEEEEAWG
jgi:hypothetical protein